MLALATALSIQRVDSLAVGLGKKSSLWDGWHGINGVPKSSKLHFNLN